MIVSSIYRILLSIYSIYAWSVLFLVFMTHATFAQLLSPFQRFFRFDFAFFLQKAARLWLLTGFWLTGLKLEVDGLEYVPKHSHFIVVSNHQSILDIAVYVILLPIRFLTKDSAF